MPNLLLPYCKWDLFLGDQKSRKGRAILRDFSYNSALFGLLSYNDPSCFFQKIPWRKKMDGIFDVKTSMATAVVEIW